MIKKKRKNQKQTKTYLSDPLSVLSKNSKKSYKYMIVSTNFKKVYLSFPYPSERSKIFLLPPNPAEGQRSGDTRVGFFFRL